MNVPNILKTSLINMNILGLPSPVQHLLYLCDKFYPLYSPTFIFHYGDFSLSRFVLYHCAMTDHTSKFEVLPICAQSSLIYNKKSGTFAFLLQTMERSSSLIH